MKHRRHGFICRIFMFLPIFLVLSGCIGIRVNQLPAPPPSVRLRVYVQAVSQPLPQGLWPHSHEEFAKTQVGTMERQLQRTGIFEVAKREEAVAALADQTPTRHQLEGNHWALAREIGGALHAEYVLIAERGTTGGADYTWEAILVNVETGKEFGVFTIVKFAQDAQESRRRFLDAIQASYPQIFKGAREDLLATALKKSERMVIAEAGNSPSAGFGRRVHEAQEAREAWADRKAREAGEASEVKEAKEGGAPSGVAGRLRRSRLVGLEQATVPRPRGGERLVVYELDASESYRTVSRILTEALREELYRVGRFELVDRDSLDRAMEEDKLQQSGVVDEKEAVRLGLRLSARQVLTGKLSILGNTLILQAKRTDADSLKTLAIQSLKCTEGNEMTLFERMPQLARDLAKDGGARVKK